MDPWVDFKWSDAWLLQALWHAGAKGEKAAPLKDIIGMGDALNHAVFTHGELRNGFARLTKAGYVLEEPGGFKVAGAALRFLAKDDLKGGAPLTLIDRTADFLEVDDHRVGETLPEDPVWPYPSLTDQVISGAFKEYSREFWRQYREMEEKERGPLSNAYLRKDIPKLKELIETGAKVDRQDKDKKTVLCHAAGKGNAQVVKYLLEKGAKVDLEDDQGDLPLHHAARSGSGDVVRLLLEAGSPLDPGNRWGCTPLWSAVKHWKGKDGAIRALLSAGADRDLQGLEGRTPRGMATASKDPVLISLLEGR